MKKIVIRTEAMNLFDAWLRTWNPYGKKCCLVYGPIGSGKTFTIRYVAEKLGYLVYSPMTKDEIDLTKLGRRSLFGNKRLLHLDRAYEMGFKNRDLKKLIKEANLPIVIEDVPETRKFYSYLGCAEIYVRPPPKSSVVMLVKKTKMIDKPNYSMIGDDVRQAILIGWGSSGYESVTSTEAVKKFFMEGRAEYLDKKHLPILLDNAFKGYYGWRLFEFIQLLVSADLTGRMEVLKGYRPQFYFKNIDNYFYERLRAFKEKQMK